MQRLLAPGGKYYHPRIVTEVAVSEQGTIVGFGRKSRPKGTIVKDVAVLKPGTTRGEIDRFITKASDVTELVVDLKVGRRGARLRQLETLRRFGVTNVKMRPYSDLPGAVPRTLSRIRWARKLRGVPVLSAVMLGLTLSEVAEAAETGDLDRVVETATGMDILKETAESVGTAAEKAVRTWALEHGVTREQKEEAVKKIE